MTKKEGFGTHCLVWLSCRRLKWKRCNSNIYWTRKGGEPPTWKKKKKKKNQGTEAIPICREGVARWSQRVNEAKTWALSHPATVADPSPDYCNETVKRLLTKHHYKHTHTHIYNAQIWSQNTQTHRNYIKKWNDTEMIIDQIKTQHISDWHQTLLENWFQCLIQPWLPRTQQVSAFYWGYLQLFCVYNLIWRLKPVSK